MCLSTVLVRGSENPDPVARNVAEVRVRDGKLVFTDIMGAVTEIDGEIEKIDLMDNYIYISTK